MSSPFDWSRVSDLVCSDLAAALDWPPRSAAEHRRKLAEMWPHPNMPLMAGGTAGKSWGVTRVLIDRWLREEPSAREHVYGQLPATRKRNTGASRLRKPSRATQLRRIQATRVHAVAPHLLERFVERGTPFVDAARAIGELSQRSFVSASTQGNPPGLLPHQEEAVAALRARFRADGLELRGLLVMPTGSGKTRTAVSWLMQDVVSRGQKVLWVTHRRELMTQTARAFVQAAPHAAHADRPFIGIRQVGGGRGPSSTLADPMHDIVIASVGALARRRRGRRQDPLRAWLRANDVVVVFDEAHHSPAKTWREVLELARDETGDAVLGLTATPTRTHPREAAELLRLYGPEGDGGRALIHESFVGDLIARGVLARPVLERWDTGVRPLDDVAADERAEVIAVLRDQHRIDERLAAQLQRSAPRNAVIVKRLAARTELGKTVAFAVNILHAAILTKQLNEAGVPAGAVHSGQSGEDNASVLDRFALPEEDARAVRVLVNVEQLTEGVDVPHAQTVVLARPTTSEALLKQMVGRVLRGPKVGGTPHAFVIDVTDEWGELARWLANPRTAVDLDLDVDVVGEPAPAAPEHPSDEKPESDEGDNEVEAPDLDEIIRVLAQPGGGTEASEDAATRAVGLLRFELREENAEPLLVRHVVLRHEVDGYRELLSASGGDAVAERVAAWPTWTTFFEEPPGPPAIEVLQDVRAYAEAEGEFPVLHLFEVIDELDPERIADRLVAQGVSDLDAIERVVAVEVSGRSELVQAIWGSDRAHEDRVVESVQRRRRGERRPVEDRRIPNPRSPELEDWTVAAADDGQLRDVVEEVCADRGLFPRDLPMPDDVRWSRPGRSTWGWYRPDSEDPSAPRGSLLVINRLLASERVPGAVLRCLVFHELLHHAQYVTPWQSSGHDVAFREREGEHPSIEETDRFLDTFRDRFSSLDG